MADNWNKLPPFSSHPHSNTIPIQGRDTAFPSRLPQYFWVLALQEDRIHLLWPFIIFSSSSLPAPFSASLSAPGLHISTYLSHTYCKLKISKMTSISPFKHAVSLLCPILEDDTNYLVIWATTWKSSKFLYYPYFPFPFGHQFHFILLVITTSE